MNTRITNKNRNARPGQLVAHEMILWMCALAVVITSAIWTKERGSLPALAGIETTPVAIDTTHPDSIPMIELTDALPIETPNIQDESERDESEMLDPSTRWFDGKMIRPIKVIYMTVTGYSPDARSCGKYADNKTATMHSVWTNGMNLVAADPRVLPYWSMVSIPGYANDDIVPVLDCGGAIKGSRLDLLYPTHKLALNWGIRQLPVTVWGYVDEQTLSKAD